MSAKAHLYQVVTFATDPLHGNPAYVLADADGASDRALVGACEMLRADVIAVVGRGSGVETPLSFYTAEGPHPGAGHSTLAAAHTVLRNGDGKTNTVFHLANGDRRSARVDGDRISVDFPMMPRERIDLLREMEAALGARPRETLAAAFGYVAVFDDAETVAGMQPDLAKVAAIGRTAVIVTAPAKSGSDVVIRVFAPNAGLPEDPVCGTAHRIIVPYWVARMGKTRIHSRHLSPRGGDLWCEDKGDQVAIAGETSLVVDGSIRLAD